MSTRGHQLRMGVFVLLAFALLAGLVLLFGSLPDAWSGKPAYTFRFEDAPGVAPGTPVRKSGVKIGEVRSVDLDYATGAVLVGVRLDAKYRPRAGELPTVSRGLLTADTNIDLISADWARLGDFVPPGSEIAGAPAAGNLMTAAQDIIPDVQKSLEQIRRSMQKLEDLTPKVGTTLDEFTELAKAGRAAVPQFTETAKAIQQTAGDASALLKNGNVWIDETKPKLNRALDNAASTLDAFGQLFNEENRKNTTELLKNLNDATKNLDRVARASEDFLKQTQKTLENADRSLDELRKSSKPLGDKLGLFLDDADVASKQLALALVEVREMARQFTKADGTVSRFLNDPTLYNSMNQASVEFAKAMPRIDRILKDLEVFADKIARHPERLGVNGVIRPDSGIKENPYAPPPAFLQPARPIRP